MSAFTTRLDDIEGRLNEELSISLKQQQSIAAIQLELATLRLQLDLALAVLEQEPTPAQTIETSAKNREDICYRALPVQEALLDMFPNIYLCTAIEIPVLFRMEGLGIDVNGYTDTLLSRTDFADMPNLRGLGIDHGANAKASLLFDADAPHDLTGLEYLSLDLNLTANNTTQIPDLDLLPSNLRSLELELHVRVYDEDGNNRWPDVVVPADMFASTPNLEALSIRLDRGCLRFHTDALSGLNRLTSLELSERSKPLPDSLFRDLVSLEDLRVNNYVCKDGEVPTYRERRVIILPSQEVLSRLEDLCWSEGTRCEVLAN